MKIKGLLLLGFILLLFWTMISEGIDKYNHMHQVRAKIQTLKYASVKQIIISPTANSKQFIRDTMIIKDLITIRQMIDDYKALRPNVGGRGRMDVRSSVNINFQLVDGSEIISLVSHNEFGNLVFIPTNEMQEWTSNNLFMDNDQQDIGLILQRYKK